MTVPTDWLTARQTRHAPVRVKQSKWVGQNDSYGILPGKKTLLRFLGQQSVHYELRLARHEYLAIRDQWNRKLCRQIHGVPASRLIAVIELAGQVGSIICDEYTRSGGVVIRISQILDSPKYSIGIAVRRNGEGCPPAGVERSRLGSGGLG